jgi:hypothetical protein
MPSPTLRSHLELEAFLRAIEAKELSGLNVQEPWAGLILKGSKTIETRTYPCPKGFVGPPIGIVATQRRNGLKAALAGIVRIQNCIQYKCIQSFRADEPQHLVSPGTDFDWKDPSTPKWGWTMEVLAICVPSILVQGRRGIVWTRALNF